MHIWTATNVCHGVAISWKWGNMKNWCDPMYKTDKKTHMHNDQKHCTNPTLHIDPIQKTERQSL